MTKQILVLAALMIQGCAASRRCPDAEVSVCRAEKECGKGSFGHVFGTFVSGMGAGLAHQSNATTDAYNACVARNLDAQKFNRQTASE